jgi:hypothetical protein
MEGMKLAVQWRPRSNCWTLYMYMYKYLYSTVHCTFLDYTTLIILGDLYKPQKLVSWNKTANQLLEFQSSNIRSATHVQYSPYPMDMKGQMIWKCETGMEKVLVMTSPSIKLRDLSANLKPANFVQFIHMYCNKWRNFRTRCTKSITS